MVRLDGNARIIRALPIDQAFRRSHFLPAGTGELTFRIHQLVASDGNGKVVGVDVSPDMIRGAETNSSAPGLRYAICDGHELQDWLERERLSGTFDKVFSSAALHWMKFDPPRVAQGMSAALKPNGRLAIEMGGHLNTIGVRSALHAALTRRNIDPHTFDPWYFPTPAAYSALLANAGFTVERATLVPRPTPLPQGSALRGWLKVCLTKRWSVRVYHVTMLIRLHLRLSQAIS